LIAAICHSEPFAPVILSEAKNLGPAQDKLREESFLSRRRSSRYERPFATLRVTGKRGVDR